MSRSTNRWTLPIALLASVASCKRRAPEALPTHSVARLQTADAQSPSPDVAPVAADAPAVAATVLAGTNPRGCIGWSAARRAFACVEGHWGHNVADATWQLVVHQGSTETSVDLSPGRDSPSPSAVTNDSLPADKVAAAQARLTAGAFVPLGSMERPAPAGAIVTVPGGSVHYTRTAAGRARRGEAPKFNERVFLVSDLAGSASVEVFSADDQATGAAGPVVTVYPIDAETIAVHRLAETNDEGVAEVEARAWICNLTAHTCR